MANQNPAVRTAFDFYMSRGYSQAQTAGIVGNLLGESNLRTNAIGDGGKARGIAQWHPDRFGYLEGWARSQGKDPNDLITQLEMVDHELRTREKGAFNRLMGAKTVDEATAAFIGFERPAGWTLKNPRGGHNYSGRLQYASDVFGLMTGVAPSPVRTLGIAGDAGNYQLGNSGNSVSVSDMTNPVTPFTTAEQRVMAQAQEDTMPDTSLWRGVQDAINTDWSLSALWREKPEVKPDASFRLTRELVDELTKGIPEQYWDRFGDSQSLGHAQDMRRMLADQLAAEQRLSSMGATGTALRIGAGLTDPLAWAAAAGVSVVSFGAGLPVALGARFGKVGMIGLTAAEAGAGTAISEAVLAGSRPTYEDSEFYWSVGLGMGLGGAFGALRRNPHTQAEADAFEQIGRNLRDSTALTPNGGSTAGAAQTSAREGLRTDTADIIRDAESPEVFGMKGARFDNAFMLKNSDNDLTSMIGNVLVEDGARNAKGLTPIGASEVQARLQLKADTRWSSGLKANWQDFKKRNPKASRDEFNRQISTFVRDREVLTEFDPAVKAQGAVMREVLGDWVEIAANPGLMDGRTMRAVRGFEDLARNQFYVPRIFDLGAIQNALDRFGHGTLSRLISKGMQEANGELAEELADKIATGYVRKLHGLSAGELQMNSKVFSGEDLDGLKAQLMDGTDLAEAEIEQFIAHMKPGKKDGASRHGKSRMLYDENFTLVLPRRDGTGGEEFRISDLFLNDADRLMTSYNRQMSGRVAMARMQIRNAKWREGDAADEFFVNGITSDGEWQKLMAQVVAVGDEKGVQAATQKDLKRLQWTYDTIVGKPHWEEGSDFNQFLRMARDYNFIRVMGQVGWAQLSETMNTVSQLGLKASVSNMPTLRSLWRNAKTGKLDDALAQEIEDMTSLGTDWVRHDSHRRHDLFDNPLDTWNSKTVQGIDDALQKGKRAVSAMSGMAPINTILQRWTGRAIFNRFANMAREGVNMNPRRLEALGLDKDRVDAIMESIRTHATFDGKRLKAMNFSKWTDRDALASFEAAAFRLGRTIIQENDIGQMAMWMSRPLARTLLQFRSFAIASYTKQLLQGLNFRDTTTATAFLGTTVAASMVYIAKTHLNSLGRSDREEWLEKRLSLDRIAAAGVQNSAWASILPGLFDTAYSSYAGAPLFDARNTQLSSDAFLGNPTVDLLDGVKGVLDTMGELGNGKELSQADMRNMLRTLPFQNLNGVAQLSSAMIGDLPEWAPKSRRD